MRVRPARPAPAAVRVAGWPVVALVAGAGVGLLAAYRQAPVPVAVVATLALLSGIQGLEAP